MRGKDLFEKITNIDDEIIKKTDDIRKKRKPMYIKWVAVAACLCLTVLGTSTLQSLIDNNSDSIPEANDTVAQLYFTDEPQKLILELVEWKDEGFKAIVINGDEQELFPKDGKLSVIFEDVTEIILEDGTLFNYSADNPKASEIGWEEGCEIVVTFTAYEEYLPGNNFYNRIYAINVEQVNP